MNIFYDTLSPILRKFHSALKGESIIEALRLELDDSLRRAVARQDVPLAVGAIANSRETIYSGGYGSPDAHHPERLDPKQLDSESVFYVASMAKPLTTMAALKLAEEGGLSLIDPLSRWMPEASKLMVFEGFDELGRPLYREPRRAVTLRDLMTHSAGFAHRGWNRELLDYEQRLGLSAAPPVTVGRTPPLLFDPGERWEYSGTAIDLLGHVIEQIAGTSIGTHLKSTFFEPLGMVSTGWELSPSMMRSRVEAYRRRSDGGFDALDAGRPPAAMQPYGGGGLYSTAADYLAFLRMLLRGGEASGRRILASSTVDAMAASHFRGSSVGCLRSTDPGNARDVEFFPGQRKSWGLGFLLNDEASPTGRQAGSLSWFGALNTFFWVDRASDVAGVFFSQFRPCADEGALNAFSDFEKTFYASLN